MIQDKHFATLNLMNLQLIESTKDVTQLNHELYEIFNERARDSAIHASIWQKKALSIKGQSDSLYNYINESKLDFIMRLENLSKSDQVDLTSTNWIVNKNDQKMPHTFFINEGKATTMNHYLQEYRSQLLGVIRPIDSLETEILRKSLQFYPNIDYRAGNSYIWELENFDKITAIEVITNLTYLQNRVRSAEHLVISYLMHEYLY